tara:strand:+ start:3906 stop:5381 length:1476 start_codon:yes stop_codon:yes gene_type:complete
MYDNYKTIKVMKIIYIVVFGFIFINLSGCGTENKNLKPIIITGEISDEVIKSFERQSIIRFYNTFNPLLQTAAEIVPIEIKNNRFKIKLTPESDISYFEFRAKFIPSLYLDLFLVQPGDSICLHMPSMDNVYFTGRGAEKLNYQVYVGKTKMNNFKTFFENNENSRKVYEQMANINYRNAIDSLNRLPKTIPEKVYEVLRISTATAINDILIRSVSSGYSLADNINKKQILDMFQSMNRQQTSFLISDPYILKNAFDYTNYLFTFQDTYCKLLSGNLFNKISPEVVYNNIKTQFTGNLKDRLIAQCFLRYKGNSQIMKHLPEALEEVKDSLSYKILYQFAKARKTGVKAYDFVFETPEGEKISLSDFKGKVVVIDTWFNGCPGCVTLAKKMEPIMKKYKDKDVAFLSINVDAMKSKFISGVQSGLYGNDQSIYAYTNGKGQHDPFLIYYQYSAYPNLLIIDKTGKVISSNPPKPISEDATEEFLKIIDSNL